MIEFSATDGVAKRPWSWFSVVTRTSACTSVSVARPLKTQAVVAFQCGLCKVKRQLDSQTGEEVSVSESSGKCRCDQLWLLVAARARRGDKLREQNDSDMGVFVSRFHSVLRSL